MARSPVITPRRTRAVAVAAVAPAPHADRLTTWAALMAIATALIALVAR